MRSLLSRAILAGSAALVTLAATAAAWTGCSTEGAATPVEDATHPFESGGDTRVQVVDVRDDATPTVVLCGEEQLCDPDVPAICTPLKSDAAIDVVVDAEDAGSDGSTAGSTSACRIVKR